MKNTTPAVLFYQEDFITGVAGLTMEQRGQYITLLTYQNIAGHLSKEYIDMVCPNCSPRVLEKFEQDEDGNYFNARMEQEIERRVNYQESRRRNRSKSQEDIEKHMNKHMSEHMKNHMDEHMETETVTEIINHLNQVTNSNYKANTKATKAKVKARLNEGYTLNDFIAVIDTKAEQWLGTDMAKYLRPETLFGPKFEGYLQEPRTQSTGNGFLDLLREMGGGT